MNATASQRLIKLVPREDPSFPAISLEDVAKVQVDAKMRTDIMQCLYDVDPAEIFWGLWFCEALLSLGKLDNRMRDALIQQIPSFLKSGNVKIRSAVVPIVIKLREELPEYRDWMLQCLRDTDPTVRWDVLMNSQTFLKPREIEPLLAFKDDDYLTETSMGSPLVYILRNEALERIEKNIGKTFERRQLSEIVEGGETAFWWDWKPFLEWWDKRQNKWQFWKSP